ncbi:Cobalt transporter subunit CbtA [Neorhizobium galegae bv. officinalis bv. officinalis str. HAMBI 1141]|uniref:Cobalt transporter subunit CbtA n=1 Tax=Neorhizobium galegae bv. officinalis bv. officinalis str. HAMBI 1141 TaxID=1028801 RepID=A0A068TDU6_NEOGA|nr:MULTISPECIES: CbtA family protein [Neorhizobium]MCJ9754520.1 CbtA family protein [Neorhizobium sp. BETTINA12A]CDN56216.1 Cobalt transporter subunit CbtA [Neorhizobium galegae bv. officinalis bv. officinalis str. HAMBI 1141]
MSLFRNIVFTAVIAGLLSGLLLTVMQSFSTVPLILRAEVFENAAPEAGHSHDAAPAAGAASSAAEHHHGEEAWAPADGFERFIYTLAADMLSAIGFALVLIAASEAFGGFKGWRGGLMFGIAGFLTVILAPGLGLPPELPGMPAAELGPRQIWWVSTAVCTAIGLGLLAYTRSAVFAALAVVLLIAPHLVGAPLPPSHETAVPMDLYARFVNAVYATNLVFWAVLGALAGVVREKFRAGEEASAGSSAKLASR